jgi:hypothetical protein
MSAPCPVRVRRLSAACPQAPADMQTIDPYRVTAATEAFSINFGNKYNFLKLFPIQLSKSIRPGAANGTV